MDSPEELSFAWLLLAGSIITFVLALAVVVFVVFYQRRLYDQRMKVAAMRSSQKKEQLHAALTAQEQERARIAKDLHDEVGATLSTAKLLLSNLPGRETEMHRSIESLVTRSIGNLRSISHNLLPPNLQDFGLVKTIEAHGKLLKQGSGIEIDFRHNLISRLDEAIEVQLYRIVQELINNTLKHAEASSITLSLLKDGDKISLQYKDDGKGFDQKKVMQNGLGLRNLENRMEMLSAEGDIYSKPGEGTGFNMSLNLRTTHYHGDI